MKKELKECKKQELGRIKKLTGAGLQEMNSLYLSNEIRGTIMKKLLPDLQQAMQKQQEPKEPSI